MTFFFYYCDERLSGKAIKTVERDEGKAEGAWREGNEERKGMGERNDGVIGGMKDI